MRWFRQNLYKRFRRALRHPRYTAKSLLHEAIGDDDRFLAAVACADVKLIRSFFDEPSRHVEFFSHLQKCEHFLQSASHPGNDLYAKKLLLQYAVVRALKPEVIVETGVANGISSSHFLLACHLNNKGHLYSVDIDNHEFLPKGMSTGWIVPDNLRSRWTLVLGDAREKLVEVLGKLGAVDIFIHDSDHTYDHMKFEFEQSYPYIRAGGLLLSDDANFNNAFNEFVGRVSPTASRVIRNIGIIKK